MLGSWLAHYVEHRLPLICLGKRTTATPLNSRHFVNFAAVVLQVGLSQLHPHSWVHRRTYSDCMFPSLASVHVKGCTCVFTQECGFLFFARHLWLLFWGVFSPTPSLPAVMEKPMRAVTTSSHDLLRLCGKNHNRGDLAVWYHVMLFFPSEETLAFWLGKPCLHASCKNISTCLKNFRETAWPPGSSWGLLYEDREASTTLFHDFLKEYTQGPPLWRNTT